MNSSSRSRHLPAVMIKDLSYSFVLTKPGDASSEYPADNYEWGGYTSDCSAVGKNRFCKWDVGSGINSTVTARNKSTGKVTTWTVHPNKVISMVDSTYSDSTPAIGRAGHGSESYRSGTLNLFPSGGTATTVSDLRTAVGYRHSASGWGTTPAITIGSSRGGYSKSDEYYAQHHSISGDAIIMNGSIPYTCTTYKASMSTDAAICTLGTTDTCPGGALYANAGGMNNTDNEIMGPSGNHGAGDTGMPRICMNSLSQNWIVNITTSGDQVAISNAQVGSKRYNYLKTGGGNNFIHDSSQNITPTAMVMMDGRHSQSGEQSLGSFSLKGRFAVTANN